MSLHVGGELLGFEWDKGTVSSIRQVCMGGGGGLGAVQLPGAVVLG